MDSDSFSRLCKKDRVYFKTAESLSELSDHHCRLGAVVVEHSHIIGSGYNSRTRCSPYQARIDDKFFPNCENRGPLHAETAALIPLMKRRYDFSGTTLYVFRKNRNGELAMARPCPRCMEVIKHCGIRKIKYSTPDGFATEKIVD